MDDRRLWMCILALCIQSTASEYCFNGTAIVRTDKDQICCGGIHQKTDQHGLPQECCRKTGVKSQVYAPKKKICCEGELHDLPNHRNYISPEPVCCGEDVILDSDSGFCCHNKIYRHSYEFAYCDNDYGVEVVVGRNQIACKHWAPNGTLVEVHKLLPGHECCSTKLINMNTHYCFGGIPWPIGAVVSECGEEQYDMNKNLCCEGKNQKKSQVYAPKKRICCEGELHDLPKHRNHNNQDQRCCGQDVIFDQYSRFCCNNKTYRQSDEFAYCDALFGVEVVVGRNQIACKHWTPNETLVKVHKSLPGHECCSTKLINMNTHFCFGGIPWPIGTVVSECGEEQYDMNKNLCCEGKNQNM